MPSTSPETRGRPTGNHPEAVELSRTSWGWSPASVKMPLRAQWWVVCTHRELSPSEPPLFQPLGAIAARCRSSTRRCGGLDPTTCSPGSRAGSRRSRSADGAGPVCTEQGKHSALLRPRSRATPATDRPSVEAMSAQDPRSSQTAASDAIVDTPAPSAPGHAVC